MLHRRSIKRFILIGLALMGMAVSSAHAASFYIDFGDRAGLAAPNTYGAAAALMGEDTGTWNQVSSLVPVSLDNHKGESTDAVLTFKLVQPALDGFAGQATLDDEKLLKDYFYTRGNSDNWALSITGQDIIGTYDVYYYAPVPAAGNVVTGAFTINGDGEFTINPDGTYDNLTGQQVASLPGDGSNRTITWDPDPTVITTQGTNWDVLEDVSIGSLGLLLDFPSGNNITTLFHGLSGLQLVEKTSAPIDPLPPVPLPAAFWLFGTALVAMIGVGTRRKIT